MSKHADIVKETLTYLYRRINAPTASDQTRYRIAQKALGELLIEREPPPPADLNGLTIAQVQTLVEDGAVTAEDALEFEKEGRARTTLMAWLEGRIDAAVR